MTSELERKLQRARNEILAERFGQVEQPSRPTWAAIYPWGGRTGIPWVYGALPRSGRSEHRGEREC